MGVILVIAGVARLGFISEFLAKPVVTGFIFGVAVTVIVKQLPKLLGLPSLRDRFEQVGQLVGELPETNPYTLAVGLVGTGCHLGAPPGRPAHPGALSCWCWASSRCPSSASRSTV